MKKVLLLLLCLIFAWASYAQLIRLSPSNPSGDRIKYGSTIAISGNRLAVGAPDEDVSGNDNLGTVYIYLNSNGNWNLETKLNSPANDQYGQFGNGLAISDKYLAVGSFNDLVGGRVYLYERSGTNWNKVADLVPTPNAVSFGSAIAIVQDMIIVGARGDRNGQGSIFIYSKNGNSWSLLSKINNPAPIASGFFGGVISSHGNRFIASANGNNSQGRAYIYEWNGSAWNLDGTLVSNDIDLNDRFGSGVSLFNNRAVVGAQWDDDKGGESGSAYVFEKLGGNWTQTQKLIADDGDQGDNFGSAVAVVQDKIIVTAATDEDFGSFAGSAYQYSLNGSVWGKDSKFSSLDPNQNEGFGRLVASSGPFVVFAASGDDQGGAFMGAVFILELSVASNSKVEAYQRQLNIFPNPATNFVQVDFSVEGIATPLPYRILDVQGKVQAEGMVNPLKGLVNLDGLPEGQYVLELTFDGVSFGSRFVRM